MAENHQHTKSINHELPKPIAFNCWKHHLGFVQNILISQKNYNKNDNLIREIIQFIGDSQIDYYIGNLNIFEITNEITEQLNKENAYRQNDYAKWLNSGVIDYHCLSLSDESNWTLRLGQGNDRYIHIHPSRNSKKTIRVKSSSLKTAYAFLFYYGSSDTDVTIEKMNYIRNRLAKLPVFKPTSPLTAIHRILNLYTR